jgi:hypothetical protein
MVNLSRTHQRADHMARDYEVVQLGAKKHDESNRNSKRSGRPTTLSAGVERREARRDGQGAAIMIPVRRRVLFAVLQFVAFGEEAVAAALLVAGETEKLVEGLAVHVVGGGGGEGGADERGDGEVESVGGVHRRRSAAANLGSLLWARAGCGPAAASNAEKAAGGNRSLLYEKQGRWGTASVTACSVGSPLCTLPNRHSRGHVARF